MSDRLDWPRGMIALEIAVLGRPAEPDQPGYETALLVPQRSPPPPWGHPPRISREFYAPARLAFEDIEAAARSVGSYYGECLEVLTLAERYEGAELPAGQARLILAFDFAHDTRELDGSMLQALAGRIGGALSPLGMVAL